MYKYIWRSIESLSCNNFAVSVIYSECVFVALGVQRAMRMRHSVIYGLSGCTVFFHIISQTARFSKKKLLNTKRVFWFSLQFSLKGFLSREGFIELLLKLYIGLHVKYPLWLFEFNHIWILSKYFRKIPSNKFHENRSSGSGVFHADRQTDRQIDIYDEANSRLSPFSESA